MQAVRHSSGPFLAILLFLVGADLSQASYIARSPTSALMGSFQRTRASVERSPEHRATAAELMRAYRDTSQPDARLMPALDSISRLDLGAANFMKDTQWWEEFARSQLSRLKYLDVSDAQGVDRFLMRLAANPTLSRLETIDATGSDLTLESFRSLRQTRTTHFVRDQEQLDQMQDIPVVRLRIIIGEDSPLLKGEAYDALCGLLIPSKSVFAYYRDDPERSLHEAQFKVEAKR